MRGTEGTPMTPPLLTLASNSPRRTALLDQIGVTHLVMPVNIDESAHPNESPQTLVSRLAESKALAGAKASDNAKMRVLGADTIVVLGDTVLGKPQDAHDAARMLTELSGREHEVLTAVTLCHGKQCIRRLSASTVCFTALTAARISAYVATGEPLDKAGGYAIQGRAAAFVTHLKGSYSGVMGLPLFETVDILRESGLEI